jgi:hypothetical protein
VFPDFRRQYDSAAEEQAKEKWEQWVSLLNYKNIYPTQIIT